MMIAMPIIIWQFLLLAGAVAVAGSFLALSR